MNCAEKVLMKYAAEDAVKRLKIRNTDSERDIIGKLYTLMKQFCCHRVKFHFPRLKETLRFQGTDDRVMLNQALCYAYSMVRERDINKNVDNLREIVYSSSAMLKEANRIIGQSEIVCENLLKLERSL